MAVFGAALMWLSTVNSYAQSQTAANQQQVNGVRDQVVAIGTGVRVRVKLRDRTSMKGTVGAISDNRFELINPHNGTITPIPYDQVGSVQRVAGSSSIRSVGMLAAVVGSALLLTTIFLRGTR